MGRKRNNIGEEEAPKIKKAKQEERMEDFTPILPAEVVEQYNRLDREYFDLIPPGFLFQPTGQQIINYLRKKLLNLPMPLNRIRDANVYSAHPWDLTSMYKLHRGKEWYFFTPRTKKYPNGQRPDRAAGNGYWKATAADVPIHDKQGVKIGTKKTLVYYEGIPKEKNTTKTDWIMHEYRVADDYANNVDPDAKKDGKELDKCVLCVIYDRSSKEDPDANDNQQDDNNMMIVPADNREYPYQNPNGAGPIIPVQNWQVQSPNTDQGQDGANFHDTSHFFMPNVNVQNDNITQGLEGGCFRNMTRFENVQLPNPNITHGVYGDRFNNMESGPHGGGFDNTTSLQMQNDSLVVGNNLYNTVALPLSYDQGQNSSGLPLSYDDQGQNIYARHGPYSESWMNGHDQQGFISDASGMVQAQNQYDPSFQPSGYDAMGLMGSGVAHHLNYDPNYDNLTLDDEQVKDPNTNQIPECKDGEVGGADVALSSNERRDDIVELNLVDMLNLIEHVWNPNTNQSPNEALSSNGRRDDIVELDLLK